ncbi:MAG TPA: hypothetical protein VGB85_00155 [Nannocystis sp.]|jgi:hypothetical protein
MRTSHPLTAFSFYLSGRNQVLLSVADEVLDNLDRCAPGEEALPAGPRARASDLMWLWTLGAYEVTRTMCQAHACFAARFLAEVGQLKVDLERVRVPNTKMEKIKYDRKGATIPVRSDRSPDLWDAARKDLLVGDPADAVSARSLLAEYARVIASLRADEVLMRHEDAFTG